MGRARQQHNAIAGLSRRRAPAAGAIAYRAMVRMNAARPTLRAIDSYADALATIAERQAARADGAHAYVSAPQVVLVEVEACPGKRHTIWLPRRALYFGGDAHSASELHAKMRAAARFARSLAPDALTPRAYTRALGAQLEVGLIEPRAQLGPLHYDGYRPSALDKVVESRRFDALANDAEAEAAAYLQELQDRAERERDAVEGDARQREALLEAMVGFEDAQARRQLAAALQQRIAQAAARHEQVISRR